MICDYSHTVTQYAGYKVVSWSSSECCRFLLHNRGIRFMLRKIHHTRSARRLTTNYINMIRLKTFSSPLEIYPTRSVECSTSGMQIGKQCFPCEHPTQTNALPRSSPQKPQRVLRVVRTHWIRGPTWKKSADPILGCFNLQLCELHPWLWVKTHGIFFCSHHSLTIPKIIACDSIIIPIPENKHVKPHFSWWLATISGLEVDPTIG